VEVERGSGGCLFWRRFLVLIFTCHLYMEAVLTEIQDRLDPHPNPPPKLMGRELDAAIARGIRVPSTRATLAQDD
jgi:hypothetical protein